MYTGSNWRTEQLHQSAGWGSNYYAAMIFNLAKKYNCTILDFRKIFHDYELLHNPDNVE